MNTGNTSFSLTKTNNRNRIEISLNYQRNLRPVVSVGVSTECARLEYEGHHANRKNGCYIFKQNLSHLWIGDLKVFCT